MKNISFSYITIVEFRTVAEVGGKLFFFPVKVYVETVEVFTTTKKVVKGTIPDKNHHVNKIEIVGVAWLMGADMKSQYLEPEQLPQDVREAIERRAILAVDGTLPGPMIDTEYNNARYEP